MLVMIGAGTWTLPAFTNNKLIEVFVSKSTWHSKYSKLFPQVKNYPNLAAWFDHGLGCPSDFDVFGIEKQSYTFKDLEDVLDDLRKKRLKRKGGDGVGAKRASSKGKQHL